MTDVKQKSDTGGGLAPGKRRDVRRLAMQVLYQLDASGINASTDRQTLLDGLDDEFDKAVVREQGVDLALSAWAQHKEADEKVEALSPEWPTHRQPPVDRAILRLAYHEMAAGLTPAKVAINEAVELAKQYGSEQSAAFVNGILDKLAKNVGDVAPQTPEPQSEQAWLDDAKEESTKP